VTTGIYCRPGCSARPNRENLRSYALAAAAEADGFRACYRCRPYRESVLAPWTAPELVCRAVQLILDGALDTDNERHWVRGSASRAATCAGSSRSTSA
jgi:AraC family transcriptional regulator, regulatory protein of adaptative response / DNA-3-methyladenine glycosylase II